MSNDDEKKIFEENGVIVTNKRVICEDREFLTDDCHGILMYPDKSLSEVVITAFLGYGIIAIIVSLYAGFLIALILFVLSFIFTVHHRYYKNNHYTVFMTEVTKGSTVLLKTADKLFAEKVINIVRRANADRSDFIKNQKIASLKAKISQLDVVEKR
jgi:hypothetical protein